MRAVASSLVALLLAAAGLVPPAAAEIVATSTRSNIFSQPRAMTTLKVPLNNAGATTLEFSASRIGQRFIITFSAECFAVAWRQLLVNPVTTGNEMAAVSILAKVNGVGVGPQPDGADIFGPIFCSSLWPITGQNPDGFRHGTTVSASRTVVFTATKTGVQKLSFDALINLYPGPIGPLAGDRRYSAGVYYTLDDIVVTVEK